MVVKTQTSESLALGTQYELSVISGDFSLVF